MIRARTSWEKASSPMASNPNRAYACVRTCHNLEIGCFEGSTGLSIKKVIQALRPLQQITVRIAGHEHTATDPLTPTARTILDALKISPQ